MRKWSARQSLALLRPALSHDTAVNSSAAAALRSFHISAPARAEGENDGKSTPAPPQRKDRLQRSRDALSQIKTLNSNATRGSSSPAVTEYPVGLRGNVFRSGQAEKGGVNPRFSNPSSRGGNSTQNPPAGAVMARRVPQNSSPNRRPVNSFEPKAGGQQRFQGPGGKSGGGQGRFGGPRGGKGGNRRSGDAAGRPARRKRDKDNSESVMEAGDEAAEMPDGLVRHLLKEQDLHHGSKEYTPHSHTAAELLAWTDSQLPPLPGTAPKDVLAKYLDSTVSHRPEHALTETMDPVKQDARRLIEGHLVQFTDERIKKGAMLLANAPRMQQARKDAAEKLGLDPGASIEFSELPAQLRKKTEEAVVAGKYEITSPTQVTGKTSEEKVMKNTLAMLQQNATYKSANVARFLDAVEGLLEGKPRPTAPQVGKT